MPNGKKTRSVPACAVCLHTNERFSLHMLRVFLNAVAEKLVEVMFKRRSVPACAVFLHTNERFCLHMLRVFFNASLKNSGNVLFKIKVCPCMCRKSLFK